MKIVIEAGSMAELRALLEEMTMTPVMATPNAKVKDIMTPAPAAKTPNKKVVEDMKKAVEDGPAFGGEFKNMDNGKANPLPAPPSAPALTREIVLEKIKKVKEATDPEIGNKVKAWLQGQKIVKLADCTSEQFATLLSSLGIE